MYNATEGRQVPWESSTLVKPFRFVTAEAVQDPAEITPVAGTDDTTRTTGDTATPLPVLPDSVTLTLDYDRAVEVGPALDAALGLPATRSLAFVKPVDGGALTTGADGRLYYKPLVSERRAGTTTLTLTEGFVTQVEGRDGPQDVTVTVEMNVNGCDLAAGDALDPGGVGFYRLANEIDVREALRLCSAAVTEHPETARFHYQLGRAQRASGAFEAAYMSFGKAADMGHVRAMNALGIQLNSDRFDRAVVDIPSDPERARALWETGIEAGDPYAMHSLGLQLLRHATAPEERERGYELLNRAAELGHTFSMNELGVWFLTKDSGYFQPERGMAYLNASAERKDIYGYHNLGFVALFGLDTGTPDYPRARDWFERAAKGGHPNSPATLGRMIVRGQIDGVTPADAVQWYDLGLSRGDGWGGVNAARMILNGEVAGFSRPEALIRAAKALHLSSKDAADAAAKLLADQPSGDLGLALQRMLRDDLGQQITVDGAVGPGTRRVIEAVADAVGLTAPANDLQDQISFAARAFWVLSPTRPDVF